MAVLPRAFIYSPLKHLLLHVYARHKGLMVNETDPAPALDELTVLWGETDL